MCSDFNSLCNKCLTKPLSNEGQINLHIFLPFIQMEATFMTNFMYASLSDKAFKVGVTLKKSNLTFKAANSFL